MAIKMHGRCRAFVETLHEEIEKIRLFSWRECPPRDDIHEGKVSVDNALREAQRAIGKRIYGKHILDGVTRHNRCEWCGEIFEETRNE